MIDFSVSIETAFAEENRSFPDRVRAAAKSGFPAVEIWDWWTKPLDELGEALRETDTELHTLCVEHWQDKCDLGDAGQRQRFVERVERAAAVAVDLATPKLVILAGDRLDDVGETEQHDVLLATLEAAAQAIAGSGLELLLEVVNRQFEGPNALVADTQTAIALLRRLGRQDVRLLYDRYHAILNGEPIGWAIADSIDLVGHVQGSRRSGAAPVRNGNHRLARRNRLAGSGWL